MRRLLEAGRGYYQPRTYELGRSEFARVEREPIEIKGQGAMTTWFLRPGSP